MVLKKQLKSFSNYLKKQIPIIKYKYSVANYNAMYVDPKYIFLVLNFLKLHTNTQYNVLTCISCVDYPHRNTRFEVSYELLSLRFNSRIRIKTLVDELTPLVSSFSIFPGATWWEREIWDLFGIFFENNDEMRRILTDYGFEGHPLRKDFPLSGYTEVRYDELKKRVICEEIEHAQEFRVFEFRQNWVQNN